MIMFSYFGGKNHIKEWVIERLSVSHKIFVDVFGGSGAIILNKPKAKINVYNDLDSLLCNLFRVVRDKPDEFYEKLIYLPYSKEEFVYARKILKKDSLKLNDIDRAIYTYYLFISSHNSICRAFSIDRTRNSTNAMKLKHKIRLDELNLSLQNVIIQNEHFTDIFRHYDTKDTLFYCDPPYLQETRMGSRIAYKHEMKSDEHEILLDLCINCKGKVVISGYNSDVYNNTLNNWIVDNMDVFKHSYYKEEMKNRPTGSEYLWIKPNTIKKDLQIMM